MNRAGALPRLLQMLEGLPGLDRAEAAMSAVADAVLGPASPAVRDALHGRWLGHALHPALSDLPIGFWASSAVADVLGMDRAAQTLGGVGSAAAVAAAASGIADWSSTSGSDRRLGALHGTLNTTALALELGALAARSRGRRGVATTLSLTGLATAGLSAWLGGELVFGRATMVDHTAGIQGPSQWTPTLPAADIGEGGTRCADAGGHPVLISRRQGRFSAVLATCTHAGGPLCEGEIEAGTVTCPWHGSRFDVVDGSVRGGPATFPQPRLQTRVREDTVEVRA